MPSSKSSEYSQNPPRNVLKPVRALPQLTLTLLSVLKIEAEKSEHSRVAQSKASPSFFSHTLWWWWCALSIFHHTSDQHEKEKEPTRTAGVIERTIEQTVLSGIVRNSSHLPPRLRFFFGRFRRHRTYCSAALHLHTSTLLRAPLSRAPCARPLVDDNRPTYDDGNHFHHHKKNAKSSFSLRSKRPAKKKNTTRTPENYYPLYDFVRSRPFLD